MAHDAPHTPPWAFGTVAACTLLLAAGQVLFKIGVDNRADGMLALAIPLAFGLVLLMIAGLGITWALGNGELSALYPVIALGFVWVILAGWLWFAETLTIPELLGVAAVIGGVSVIGHGNNRRRKR